MKFEKEVVAPHQTSVRLKALTLNAAINLHCSCLELFWSETSLTIKQLRKEFSARTNGSYIESPDNHIFSVQSVSICLQMKNSILGQYLTF